MILKRLVVAIALVSLGTLPGLAQQNAPVFRSGSNIVRVDVAVVDRDGKPVTGLTPDDFVVMLDGERRPVRALDFVQFGRALAAPGAMASTPASPAPGVSAPRGGRVILIVVDDLSARPSQMTGLRTAAQRMLATLDAGDLVGVATTSGLGPAIVPTRDRAAVIAALQDKAIVGRNDDNLTQLYISVPEAVEINQVGSHAFAHEANEIVQNTTTFARVVNRECRLFLAASEDVDDTCSARVQRAAVQLAQQTERRAADQLSAYTQLINALRPAPVPRILVALSAGIATGVDRTHPDDVSPVALAATKAGVQFYAVVELGNAADVADIGPDRAAARREEETFLTSGVQTVAEAAGGTAFKVAAQADAMFTRIINETSAMYQLGVEVPVMPTGESVSVKVSLARSGVSVRAHAHAMAPPPEPAAVPIDDALKARIAQGGTTFGVPITMGVARRRADPAGAIQLGVTLHIPASSAAPLALRFGLVNEAGDIVSTGRQEVTKASTNDDYWIALAIPAPAGQYRLRVAVADASGQIGSIESAVAAELARRGPLSVSDLLTMWTTSDAPPRLLAGDTLPATAAGLHVSLELYPRDLADLGPVVVRLGVFAAGAADPMLERDLTPALNGDALVVTADVPTSSLKPGAYTLRATILESGAVVGFVSKTIQRNP